MTALLIWLTCVAALTVALTVWLSRAKPVVVRRPQPPITAPTLAGLPIVTSPFMPPGMVIVMAPETLHLIATAIADWRPMLLEQRIAMSVIRTPAIAKVTAI